MRKILFLLITLLLFSASIDAQKECATPTPTPPDWIFNKGLRSSVSASNYNHNLSVFIHIVRSSSGRGAGVQNPSSIVNLLNNSFASAGIQFKLQGTDFIDNDYYYNNMDDEKAERLFAVNVHSNALDIYVLGQSTVWEYAGLANGIPAKSLIIRGDFHNTSTLAHEMGHCLGLYHTHHGTVKEAGDNRQCEEFVDGSNSARCGDYISDTPADPNKWSGCSYVGTNLDGHGQRYSPDPSNYMSYAGKSCRTRFSDLQKERMKSSIDITPLLQQVVFPYKISGSFVVCSQGTYTIQDLPSGTSIQWSTSNGNLQLISGQGTRTAVFRKNGTGRCTIKAALRSASLNITLTLDVWAGVPKTTVSTSEYKDVTSATVELILNNPATITDNMVSFSAQGSKIDPRNWVLKNYNENILGLIRDGEYVTIIPRKEGSGIFSMTALNDCGTGSPAYVTVNVVRRGVHFSLFPNPATDVVTLKLTETERDNGILSSQGQGTLTTKGITSTYEIQLWSGLTMLKSFKTNQPTFQISIAGLPAGLYFMRVIKDGQTYTEKLIKN